MWGWTVQRMQHRQQSGVSLGVREDGLRPQPWQSPGRAGKGRCQVDQVREGAPGKESLHRQGGRDLPR